MLGLGFMEIAVIAVALMIFVPPKELPKLIRQMGRWYGQLRRAADEMRRAFVLEADRQDAVEREQERRARRDAAKKQDEEVRSRAESGGARSQPARRAPAQPLHEQLGFSSTEWDELPDEIRDRLVGAANKRADAAALDPEAPAPDTRGEAT